MTHAATLRNLTQSAVSQQIKRLEQLLDVRLLARRRDGVELTEAGRKLLPHAHSIVRGNDDAISKFQETECAIDVRLGVPTDVVSSLLPAALAVFHKRYPTVNVILISDSSKQLRHKLALGEVDICLTTDRRPERDATLLFRKPLIWIGAINGTAYERTPLPVAVGRLDCPFRTAAAEALAKAHLPWRAVTQVGSLEPVFATLLADLAVAPFLPGTLPPGTAEIQSDLPQLAEFCLQLRAPERPLSELENQLWSTLLQELGQS